MLLYDTATKEVTNVACLEDEVHIEVDKFNREVITEDFNRKVLIEIIESISQKIIKKMKISKEKY